jgi:hypothetical protein
MQHLKEVIKGIESIEPFLFGYGFEFEDYQIGIGPDRHFTIASYRNESKKFLVNYHFSFVQVHYQYENSVASHPFYLDQLGFADKKLHRDYTSNFQHDAFRNILHDFEYLIEDYFSGKCTRLIEISKLHDSIITEFDRNIREESNIRIDTIRIEKARQEFRKKEFNNCLKIYKVIDNRDLLGELDNKIIEFCKRHI